MLLAQRRQIIAVLLSLSGALVGATVGLLAGRAILLRATTAVLAEYAQTLSVHADELAQEMDVVFQEVGNSQAPFCSEPDIAALRARTFRSFGLKDIGRTRDGKLYCSAFLGRLDRPFAEGSPTLSLPTGFHIYTDVPIVIAASDRNSATVVEQGSVDAVLSPDAFARWDRPYARYMIAIVDPVGHRVVRLAGDRLKLSPTWPRVGGGKIESGSAYQVHCSAMHPFCVVTAERLADVWGRTRATRNGYVILGAVAGFSISLLLALLNLRRAGIARQLRRDLHTHANTLLLVYQPLLDLTTGDCVGAEALLRWTDPDGAAISPDTFIPLAESGGFIREVTEWVIREATHEMGDLLRGDRRMTLSLNISAADLDDDKLYLLLEKHVIQMGIHPSQIALELTERSTAHMDLLAASIRKLSQSGFKVHIDDFGIGYSSLSYLDQLSVDAIKIDRSFTKSIGTNAVIAPVLPQILALAHSLGMEVVVEGVETEAQADYLKSIGQQLNVQGWFFGKPMDASSFIASCKKHLFVGHRATYAEHPPITCNSQPTELVSAGVLTTNGS